MAKRLVFRFEPILKLREQREQQEKRAVAARLGEIRRLEDRHEILQSRIADQIARSRDALTNVEVDIDQIKLARHWLAHLRRGVLQTDAELSEQRALLAQERLRLAECAKERKVLARLKERRLEAFRLEAARREQAELDEIGLLRFRRSASTEGETP